VWSLPLIFLLWANMHMGCFTWIACTWLIRNFGGDRIFFIAKKSKTEEVKSKNQYLLYAFILSIISLLVNPNFTETYLYALRHSQMQMLENINEWKSPFSSASYYYVKIYMFFFSQV
jgi:hypothetical protein